MFTSHRALPAITLLIAPGLFAQSLGPVRNAASHDERFSPGTLVEINGPFTPTSGPVTAEVGGRAAAVIARANSQLVIQLPVELTPGTASLMVTSGGVRLSPISLTIEVYAPGLYTASPYSSVGMFYRTQSSVGWPFGVDCGHPVWPRDANEVVRVYATGLGATNPAVATGEAAPANPAASTVSKPSISVSGRCSGGAQRCAVAGIGRSLPCRLPVAGRTRR